VIIMTDNNDLKRRVVEEWEGLVVKSKVVGEEEWVVRREVLHNSSKGWCVMRCLDGVGTYM